MPAGVRDIKIRFSGDASGLAKAAAQGEESVGKFSDRTQKFAKVALAGVAAFGVGMVAALKGGVQGLQEGEEAEAKFNDALSRSSAGIQRQSDALKANAEEIQKNTRYTYENALGASAFLAAQDGVRRAVADGVVSIKDATNVSLDLATVLGIDATAAAGVLAKALAAPEKATGALRKAGVTLTAQEQEKVKSLVKSGEVADAQAIIMDKLKAKTEGAAVAAGQTTAGQLDRAKNAFGEVQEQLAVSLIPTLTSLMDWLTRVTAWAQENPGKVKAVVIVLGSLAAVIGTVSLAVTAWTAITTVATAATTLWTGAMTLLKLAFLTSPIGVIVLAVTGLIAVIVLIATKTDFFQNLWRAAWSGIQAATSAAVAVVRTVVSGMLSFITNLVMNWTAIGLVVKNFDRIKSAAQTMKDGLVSIFSGVAEIITAPFRAAVDGLRSVWNSTIGGKGIPSIGIGPFKTPGFTIPMLAGGGLARGGRPHIVGEEGPELFIPGRTGTVIPNGQFGGDTIVEIHATGPTLQDIVRVEIKRADRGTKNAVSAGARRAFA